MTPSIANVARAARVNALEQLRAKRAQQICLPRFRNLPPVTHAKALALFENSEWRGKLHS